MGEAQWADDPTDDPQAHMDELIYAISHDLRASIRAVRELPEWLREDLVAQGVHLNTSAEDLLDLMQVHAGKLDAMLAGLLAYSRVGRLQEVTKLDPQEVFKGVVSSIHVPEDTSFFCRFNPAPVRLGQADAAKIFETLISNAIQHGRGDTGADIEVTSCRSGSMWELIIADSGAGIAPDMVSKAFRPMTRLNGSAESQNAGMGLAVLQRIVAAYQGSVSIEQRKRRGGCLARVRLPVLAD